MPPLKRVAANLGLVLIGVVAALIVIEIALRVGGFERPDLYTYDQWRGWALRAGAAGWQRNEGDAFVRINRYGFRGPAVTPARPPNVFRIAVLGDSFTEAQQVDYKQTFCAVMQRQLSHCSAMHGRKVQVLDFGVDGYGTAQEYMTLKHEVWKFSPNMVILAVFTGNDIRNDSVHLEGDKCQPFYTYRDGKLVLTGPFEDSSMFRMHCFLRFESRRIAVINLLGSIHSVIMAFRTRESRVHHKKEHQMESRGRTERGLDFQIYGPPQTTVWQQAWKIADGEIQMIHRNVVAHGARFVAVTLGNPMQDLPLPKARERYMKHLGVKNLFYPGMRIKAFGESKGFPVLNLAPKLQRYADAHHVFLHGFPNTRPGIGHWNATGHRLAGEYIAQFVCERMGGAKDCCATPATNAANDSPRDSNHDRQSLTS